MAACRMSTEISRRIRPGTSGAECGENGTWRSSASQSLADQTSHCQGWGRGFESLRPLQSACPQTFSADFRATKKATFRAVWELGLGFSIRNDTENLSLNGWLSPKLGSRRIYSTSFFCPLLSSLAIYR